MPPGRQLTDRDMSLLSCLAMCGLLTYNQAKAIYNNVTNYHYKRLSQLEERGYIKCGKYIEITPLGIRATGGKSSPMNVREEWKKEVLIKLSEIYIGLSGWKYLSSREVKKQLNMNASSPINAYIEKDGEGYAIYLLNKEPRKATIKSLRGSLKKLWIHGISRAIVFASSSEAMNVVDGTETKLKSLLVLPYPYGIELLKHKDQIQSYVESKLQDFVPSNRPFANYEKGNTFVSVLVFNDIIKRDALSGYLKYASAREGREVVIVCLKNQCEKFGQLFPDIKQIVIPGPESQRQEARQDVQQEDRQEGQHENTR